MKKSKYEDVIKAIARKVTSKDGLIEDCEQEGRIVAWQLEREGRSASYIRQAIKFVMLDYMRSWNTGDWYTSHKSGGKRYPARFYSLDQILREDAFDPYSPWGREAGGIQVDNKYQLHPPVTIREIKNTYIPFTQQED